MYVLLADRQDITRAGVMYILNRNNNAEPRYAEDKASLLEGLKADADSVVVVDITQFDINGVDELLILSQRFPQTRWVVFSEELSTAFVRRLVTSSSAFSVVLKDSPLQEITDAIAYAMSHRRYICQHIAEVLLAPEPQTEERVRLTKTEIEVLKDIAAGLTTRQIAEKRFSSFHTINTHRKNIFRKLCVNTAHEATMYAIRAGIVDTSDYYI